MRIPKPYDNVIQRYDLVPIHGPVVIIGVPGDSSLCLGFSANTNSTEFYPIIFPSRETAELCKETILRENPNHNVKDMSPWVVRIPPYKYGYTMQPCVAACPSCGQVSTYGNPETMEFYCKSCQKPFLPCILIS